MAAGRATVREIDVFVEADPKSSIDDFITSL